MSDASTNARNAWEAGLRVFPLYGFGERATAEIRTARQSVNIRARPTGSTPRDGATNR
jgi:hypothetical protein